MATGTKKLGKLYGVGVGPGDPELITLKGLKVLKAVSYVFTASSAKNEYSLSSRTIEPHLDDKKQLINLSFSMQKDTAVREKYWEKNSLLVLEKLREGKDVAFVTVGDPMTYSTFGYLMRTILEKEPETDIEIIPGITSYQAAAAAAKVVLSENNQNLFVMSGVEGIELLKNAPSDFLRSLNNIVVLKVYKKYGKIMKSLKELGLVDRAILVSNCTLKNETIKLGPELDGTGNQYPPYFSLLLIRKNEN